MLNFRILDARITEESLGLIPSFIWPTDGRSAAVQFNERYQHGGGWQPMKGWKMGPVGEIMYDGDTQTYPPLAVAEHGEEVIFFYESAWVSIRQPDGSFEVSRMD